MLGGAIQTDHLPPPAGGTRTFPRTGGPLLTPPFQKLQKLRYRDVTVSSYLYVSHAYLFSYRIFKSKIIFLEKFKRLPSLRDRISSTLFVLPIEDMVRMRDEKLHTTSIRLFTATA